MPVKKNTAQPVSESVVEEAVEAAGSITEDELLEAAAQIAEVNKEIAEETTARRAKSSNQNELRSRLKQTRQHASARNASWVSARRS